MRYTLKCGLSKTAIYQTLKDHVSSGILLPSLRECRFNKIRNSYWLFFENESGKWECNLCQSDGSIAFYVFCKQYSEQFGSYVLTEGLRLRVSDGYLLSHGMVRKAA